MSRVIKVTSNDNSNGFSNGKLTNGNSSDEKCWKNNCSLLSSARTSSPTYSLSETFPCPYEFVEETANYLLNKTKYRPKIGIICGSGLGHLAENLTNADSFPYEDIPNFPLSTVQGHAGKMIFGLLNGVEVMCMQGRFHYYEGYALAKCSMPVRVMKLVGCTHLVATNAAGGLNSSYNVGDIMIVKDHINIMGFAGNSPLQGPNELRFGPRFPPMGKAYDPNLIKVAEKIAETMDMNFHKGVYTCVGGPNYETVAELRMWKMLGVDAVGMSTVHEVITARHCDMKVFAFSLITNKCETEYETHGETDHADIVTIGFKHQDLIIEFVTSLVSKMNEDMKLENA